MLRETADLEPPVNLWSATLGDSFFPVERKKERKRQTQPEKQQCERVLCTSKEECRRRQHRSLWFLEP